MLIAVERLLVRVRQVPSRADELIALRARVRVARAEQPTDDEITLARELRALKVCASSAMTGTTSCHTCASGKRAPRGTFPGGDCCSSVTADLFDDDEVAALAAAGTRPRDLRAPRDPHAGCAFRGALGCTLDAAHRPVRCIHYTCMVLRRELGARGDLEQVDQMVVALKRGHDRFVELRKRRLDDELLAPLEAACGPTAHV